MNCYLHSDKDAVAYCRVCGKALCQECRRVSQGTVFCEEHLPAQEAARPQPAASYQPGAGSPGFAFVLGLIPGVGAIYNGQYVKGLIHVVILGTLISIVSADGTGALEPLFGMLIAIFCFYMPFEAYHTARKRQRGEAVDEFSSLLPLRASPSGFPIGPVVIIAIGIIFLLNTLEVLHIRTILRWWPAFLIVLGAYMLYTRITGGSSDRAPQNQEVRHEPE